MTVKRSLERNLYVGDLVRCARFKKNYQQAVQWLVLICDSRRLGPNMPILFFIYESVLTICLAPRVLRQYQCKMKLSCVLDAYPSKQDKPILPTRSGFSAMSTQLNIFFGHILNPFLINLFRSRHPGYWPYAALLHFNADIKTQK